MSNATPASLLRPVLRRCAAMALALVLVAGSALAAGESSADSGADLANWVGILAAMALLPFLLTMITPFAKLVIVGSMLRQALGTPQIPPTTVITGLALILTLQIVRPIVRESWDAYQALEQQPAPDAQASNRMLHVLQAVEGPTRDFLRKNASAENLALFRDLQARNEAAHAKARVARTQESEPGPARTVEQLQMQRRIDEALDILTVDAPAFMLTELSEAFLIAFYLFVPFFVIDLVVSNVLLAMGMHMLSPTTISVPLKVLVFVVVGGWKLFLTGVVGGYVV